MKLSDSFLKEDNSGAYQWTATIINLHPNHNATLNKKLYSVVSLCRVCFHDYSQQKGRSEKAVEDARNFYSNGASIELIAKSLNMTLEEVQLIVKDVEVLGA